MTTYKNTSTSDPLAVNDVFRITLTAPSHWYEPGSADSSRFGFGLDNLYNGSDARGPIAVLVPYSPNTDPYIDGDVAETIDFLVTGTALPTIADAINEIMSASVGNVDVKSVEKIVGKNAIPPGTSAAVDAVTSFQAQQARLTQQQNAEAATKAGGSWLSDLGNEVGTVGKYALWGGAGLLAYWLWKKSQQVRRLI